MGLRISRLAVAVLVTLFLASPCAAAAGERPLATDHVRAIAERVTSWLESITDRFDGSVTEERDVRRSRPPSKSDAFQGSPEMGAGADPYG